MPRILLATLNATYQHCAFGLRYLHANLEELKSDAALVEFTIAQSPRDIAETILSLSSEIVGFGVYIWNTRQTYDVISILKRVRPELPIVALPLGRREHLGVLRVELVNRPHLRHNRELEEIVERVADLALCREKNIRHAEARRYYKLELAAAPLKQAAGRQPEAETQVSLEDRNFTISTRGRLPEARVEFDKWLFENRLDELNRAMLVLHEEMYPIGREIGHKTSDGLRTTVALFFSGELREKLDGHRFFSDAAREVQDGLGMLYGDYCLLFVDDPAARPASPPVGLGQYSRYRSFGRLLKLLRDRKGKCLEENGYDRQTRERQAALQKSCSDKAMYPWEVEKLVNDEEAFLFLARWLIDPMGAVETSENLVVWDRKEPGAITALQSKELERACRWLAGANYHYFNNLIKRSRAYCKAAQSPKRP